MRDSASDAVANSYDMWRKPLAFIVQGCDNQQHLCQPWMSKARSSATCVVPSSAQYFAK